jgi:uncharacterized protein HemX
MRSLLLLLIALVAGAAFYEYHQNEVQVLEYERQRDEIAAHIAELKKEKKLLQDEHGVLMEKLAYLKKQDLNLKAQVAALPPAPAAPEAKH